MIKLLEDCINDLCYKCGKYEFEYEGACEGCKWYEIKENGYRATKKNKMSMKELAEDMKFWCESGEGCDNCSVCYEGYCEVGSPCEWILREV